MQFYTKKITPIVGSSPIDIPINIEIKINCLYSRLVRESDVKRLHVHLGAILRTDGTVAACDGGSSSGSGVGGTGSVGGVVYSRVFPGRVFLDDLAAVVQYLPLDWLLHRHHSHDLRLHRFQGTRLARRFRRACLRAVLLVTTGRAAMQTLLLPGRRSSQARPLHRLGAGAQTCRWRSRES